MARPRLQRHVCVQPHTTYFKPRGIPLRALQQVVITHEEMEALWLSDDRGHSQVRVAKHMRTSQSTVQRLLQSARKKVSHALIHGQAIALDNRG